MENKVLYLNELYDYYGMFLSGKQKEYFEDYYLNNLTLSEIAENNNISRNAIHKQIKDAENKLEMYEKRLKLFEKRKKIEKLIKDLDSDLKEKIEELI